MNNPWLRNTACVWIVENWKKIGGPGTVVEIDESYFAGSPKYGKGKMRDSEKGWKLLGEWPWVFGLLQRGSLLCWLEQVPDRQRAAPNCSHKTVNHKKHFVDPTSGAHSQSVECNWRHSKRSLPELGVKPKYLDYYLKTFMWRQYAKQYG